MSSLYELTDELAAAQRDLTEMLGNEVITAEEYDDNLSALLDQHKVKSVGVIAYIKSEEAEAAMFKAESDKLLKRAKAANKCVEFYKGYLLTQMLKLNQTTAGEGVHTAKIKQGSMCCVITDEHWLPDRFTVRRETYSPNKLAITAAIKAGETVEGAEMVRGDPSIKLN